MIYPNLTKWRKTDIILPNKLFRNSEFVEEGITGTGVLDVFDRYNFTVNESEPLEMEVAIDPEMPFIFLTARKLKEDKIRGLKLGADDYIAKPFDIHDLLRKVSQYV